MVAEAEGREYVPPDPEPEPEPQPEPMSEAEFQEKLDQIVRDSQRGREPEPGADPEAADQAAMYAEIHEDLAAIGEGIRELSERMDAGDARRAEAAWQQPQAQPEPALEPSWQAGDVQDAGPAPEADFEPEIG
jgi:hypothetical protein